VWAVQELVLAQKDPMVYLGRASVPWDRLQEPTRRIGDGRNSLDGYEESQGNHGVVYNPVFSNLSEHQVSSWGVKV
jgi:hypothetical protein